MVNAIAQVFRLHVAINSFILRWGRFLAWIALGLMVVVILAQVFFRYVMGNALPWPDEAARFLMLWMTGLIAPSAYRWGGFVAIDMLASALQGKAAHLLLLVLFALSGIVLIVAIGFGWKHTTGFGGNFDSSSLRVPLDLIGLESFKVKLRYMYGSLLTCVILLLSVNIELITRTLFELFAPNADIPPAETGAELMAGAD